MFKFIHAADIHLDSPLRGLSAYEDAPVDSIRSASRRAFDNLVDLAIEEEVAFVLLAGDLLDGGWKDFQTGLFLAKQLGRLGKKDIKVFVVLGNHDAENKMTKRLRLPANMHIFGSRSPKTVKLNELGVAIHGQSFASPSVTDNLALAYPDPVPGMLNIGMLHTSLDGREGHEPYAPCSLEDLRAKGYQYWALGHVHQHEIVCTDPWVVFPGCIQGRHIKETGPKGCSLVTVRDQEIDTVDTIELDVLRWAQCHIDVDGVRSEDMLFDRIQQALSEVVADADARPVAARVSIEGSTPLAAALLDPAFALDKSIRLQAAGVDPDNLWIEKIKLNVTSGRSLESVLDDSDAEGDLLRHIVDLPNSPDAVPGVDRVVQELFSKIGEAEQELVGQDGPDKLVGELIRDAKQILVKRLLKSGVSS